MANILKPKRTSTAGKVPTTSDLASGEIGVNMLDQKVYINNGTTVVQVGAGKLSALSDVTITSPTNNQVLSWNGTAWVNSTVAGGGSMVYPGAGIPNSTGTAWGTSYSVTGTGSVVLSASPIITGNPIIGQHTGNGETVTIATGGENSQVDIGYGWSENSAGSTTSINGVVNLGLDSTYDSVFIKAPCLASMPFTVSSSLFATGSIQLTGSVSANHNIATSSTTGTLTIGGQSGTGAITLGRSTSTQTVNIANGVTIGGAQKTINIGTLGSNSSTTNINIGNVSTGGGTLTFGQATGTQTTNIQAGATASGATKTLSIGTGGLSGSTTNITMGSAAGTSTTTINGSVTIAGASTNYAAVNVGTGYASQVSIGHFAGSVQLGNGGDVTVSAYGCIINASDNPVSIQTSAGGGYGTVIGMIGDGAPLVVNHSTSTFNSNVTVNGNLIINGTTTTINSNTVSVDDKNIELGAVAANFKNGTVTAGSAIVTGLVSTADIIPGSAVTALTNAGPITLPAGTTVASINSATQITLSQALTGTGGPTSPVTLTIGGATDVTANGGGITLKGATDKTILWDSANTNWTSSEHLNLPSGKFFKINNIGVLSSNTLGSGVTASSLTSLGTITSLNAGTITASADATINGITVGRGDGNVTSNTALGFDALGSQYISSVNINNVGIGYNALNDIGSSISNITQLTGGSGYDNGYDGEIADLVYVSGTPMIAGGSPPSVFVNISGGQISGASIYSGGFGWTALDTVFTIDNGNIGGTGSGATFRIASLTSATNNVAIGHRAGITARINNNSVYIGSGTTGTGSNQVLIGYGILEGGEANKVVIGNNLIATTVLKGAVTAGTSLTSPSITAGITLTANGQINLAGNTFSGSYYSTNTTTGFINFGTALTTGSLSIGGTGQTGSIEIGRSSSSGIITIGGAGGTGTITLGQSSGAQTVNIATGVNVASPKVVNIGTGGTTNTTINMGNSSGISTLNIGRSTGAETINIGSGATLNTLSKSIYIGSNGAVGSTTSIYLGNAVRPLTCYINLNGIVTFGTSIGQVPVAVASLPTGVDAVAGDRYFVNNAVNPRAGSTVVGGGAVTVPVYYNGTNWISDSGLGATIGTGSVVLNDSPTFTTNITTPAITAPTNDLTLSAISTGNINLNTPNGTAFKVLPVTLASSNWLQVKSPATTVVQLGSAGTSICELRIHSQSFTNFYTGSPADGSSVGLKQAQVSHTASAVNYVDLTGGATTKAVFLSAQGETNTSLGITTKGNGAIDLAPGTGGVNISNGGTVTALTRTNAGVGYTTPPTWSASAPTTAGGITATGTTTLLLYSPVVNAGGTGYTVGDILTVVGGTFSPNAAQLTVSTVSGGVITAVAILGGGTYTATPTYPASVTGGTGSGATFTLSAGIGSGLLIGNAGSGYIEQPTITFSGGGGSGAAAYALVGSATTFKSLNNMGVFTPGGQQFGILDSVSTSTAYWNATGGAGTADLRTNSGSTGGAFISNGAASNINFRTNINSSPATQLVVAHTASTVNYVQVTGGATGADPTISVQGADTDRNIRLSAKGTGAVQTATRLEVNTALANYWRIAGAAAGSTPTLSPIGSDTNIDLAITPKAAGVVVVKTDQGIDTQTATTTATTANQVIAVFPVGYRSVKAVIQATDATGTKYHSTEVLIVSNNTTTAEHVEYGSINIGGLCATYTVDYSSGIRILATPSTANSTVFKIAATLIKV